MGGRSGKRANARWYGQDFVLDTQYHHIMAHPTHYNRQHYSGKVIMCVGHEVCFEFGREKHCRKRYWKLVPNELLVKITLEVVTSEGI